MLMSHSLISLQKWLASDGLLIYPEDVRESTEKLL